MPPLTGKKIRIRRSPALISRQFREIISPDSCGGDAVMGRARGSVTTVQILVPAGRRTGQLDRPRRYRVFLTTPRAADRAGISIYHEPHHQGMRHDRCLHVRAGQIPQGLRTSAGSPGATTQNIPFGMAATATGTNWDWRQIGGSVRRSPCLLLRLSVIAGGRRSAPGCAKRG